MEEMTREELEALYLSLLREHTALLREHSESLREIARLLKENAALTKRTQEQQPTGR